MNPRRTHKDWRPTSSESTSEFSRTLGLPRWCRTPRPEDRKALAMPGCDVAASRHHRYAHPEPARESQTHSTRSARVN